MAGFHVALALATLIGAGELPDWGWYLNTLREFLTGSVGDLTYDFAPWTAAFAVGALYVGATIALVLTARARPLESRARPARLIALAGTPLRTSASLTALARRSDSAML